MQKNSSLVVPVAIVVGFALIAVAILFTSNGKSTVSDQETATKKAPVVKSDIVIRPVDETDYIRGNPNAPIMIIEYSDYDCPYCKIFHQTMNQVMDTYGVSGKVAWTYRQFPIVQLHPNAPRISEAAYCVGDLGGNDAFWKFSEAIFAGREVEVQTDMTQLPVYAEEVGVTEQDLNNCLASGKFADRVQQSIKESTAAGAEGTPYSVVVVGDQQAVINGAQPYTVVKQIVDNLIGQINGVTAPESTTDTVN